MGFVWSTAHKDLRRRLRDPAALVIWLAIPALLGGLMTLAMGGREGPAPQAHLLLVDEDDTVLSRLLAGSFGGQSHTGSLARVERVARAEGQARIDAGDGTALLIIPEAFAQAMLEDRPVALELITNPSQSILPAIVEEVLRVVVDGAFYVQRLIGDPYRRLGEQGSSPDARVREAAIGAFAVEAHDLWRRLEGTLHPPVIRLTTKVEGKQEEPARPSFGLLFLPGLLFMALLFVSQGIAEDLWVERESGTLRRVLVTPQALSAFLLGKLVAGLVIIGAVLMVGMGLGTWVHGIPLSATAAAWVWGVWSGLFFLLVLHVAYLFASNRRVASVLANMVMFPMMMLGGAFFPFEVMPPWMATAGRLTPNGWALVQLKAILAGTPDPQHLALTALGLGVSCLGLFLVALRQLRGGFALG